MEPGWVAGIVDKQKLIDGRNVLPVEAWQAAGWEVSALGKSA